jgi:flagellar motor component MotA
MSRFNIRPIGVTAEPPPPLPPSGKLASAYRSMKGGNEVISPVVSHVEPEKKKGRPSKEEVRRHKLAMSDTHIQLLVEDKPTRNKIRDYMEHRIMELEEEKR